LTLPVRVYQIKIKSFQKNVHLFADGYNEPPPSFMSYDPHHHHHNHAGHHDQYSVPTHYGYVQPPLGSDSGSSGYIPIPSASFSPVANKDYCLDQQQQQQQQQQQHLMEYPRHEAWNNNERPAATETATYDCY
jgi:hypothetical protein